MAEEPTGPTEPAGSHGSALGVRRRSLIRGAACTAPVVLATAPAPALAASILSCDVTLPPPADGVWSNPDPRTGNSFADNGFLSTWDSTFIPNFFVSIASPTFTVTEGATYTFTYNYSTTTAPPRPQKASFLFDAKTPAGGPAAIDTSLATAPTTGSRSYVYGPVTAAQAAATHKISFTFFYGGGDPKMQNDDIIISNFTTTCAPGV